MFCNDKTVTGSGAAGTYDLVLKAFANSSTGHDEPIHSIGYFRVTAEDIHINRPGSFCKLVHDDFQFFL